MSETVSKQKALENLQKDADNIRYLLKKQRSFLCLTECPAFEEVADTRIYGFTCEVRFAVSLKTTWVIFVMRRLEVKKVGMNDEI